MLDKMSAQEQDPPTSAPRNNSPGTRTARSEDGTRAVGCPGQAVLMSECLWNRQLWCYGADGPCCLFDDDDLDYYTSDLRHPGGG